MDSAARKDEPQSETIKPTYRMGTGIPPLNTDIDILASTGAPILHNVQLRSTLDEGYFRVWCNASKNFLPGNPLTAENHPSDEGCFVLKDQNKNRLSERGWSFRYVL